MATSNIKDFQKILMPMIRQVMPNLIATQIMGVQPMTGSSGGIFSLRTNFNKEALFRYYPSMNSKMPVRHTTNRPFMLPGDPEPNEKYRPWLEEHIGKQGYNWNWDLCSTDVDILEIYFRREDHATLFELTWP